MDTTLLLGEKVAVRNRRVLSRKGRCVVRTRVVGAASLGWLDMVMLWGTCVEAFVCEGGNVKHLVEQLYPDVYIPSPRQAEHMPPHGSCDGLLLGTIANQQDAEICAKLIGKWLPSVVILAVHGTVSRRAFSAWTKFDKA